MSVQEIEAQALQLSRHERAELARHLIASLEESDEVERSWAEEAERRYEGLRSGEVQAVPASAVFADVRSALR